MGHTINFGSEPIEIRGLKALQAIVDYLGEEKFCKLTQSVIRDIGGGLTGEQFCLIVSFAGVQGLPVRAWWNYCNCLALMAEIP